MEPAGESLPTQIIKKLIRVEAWPKTSFAIPKYQTHRGYWIEGLQENTLAAFRAAREKGSSMVEMDVQLSRDQIPVIFHDSDCSRFSNSRLKVSDLTAQELKKLVNAPTLEEVLTDSQVTPYFNIELKCSSLVGTALERKVAELIEKLSIQEKIMFSSFNPAALWRVSQYLPHVPRAYLIEKTKTSLFHYALSSVLSIHLIHLDKNLIDNEDVSSWVQNQIPIAVWTVNDEALAFRLLEQGCVSIISDSII